MTTINYKVPEKLNYSVFLEITGLGMIQNLYNVYTCEVGYENVDRFGCPEKLQWALYTLPGREEICRPETSECQAWILDWQIQDIRLRNLEVYFLDNWAIG